MRIMPRCGTFLSWIPPAAAIAVLGAGLAVAGAAPAERAEGRAEPAPSTRPSVLSSLSASRPMLDELNRETQALYHEVTTGVVRVQLPQPKWANAYAMAAIDKWQARLDPEVRRTLQQQQVLRGREGNAADAGEAPTTRPTARAPAEGASTLASQPR